jgi:hypothetical protein
LAELDQWIVWRYEQRDGKSTKVPYRINGSRASITDPKTWCSWDEALKAWQENPKRWSGIGFVFSPGDPYFGIDLDDCINDAGTLKPWAQPIMERFSDSYAEISPSAQGIKIWAKGTLPGGGTAFPRGDGRVEIYDQARYFAATGNHWAGQMLDVEEHQADLDWLLADSPHGQRKVPFTVKGKIRKGTQHDTLLSLAGTMRARGCEFAEIFALLCETNKRLEEPAPEQNIKRIAASVCKYPDRDDGKRANAALSIWQSTKAGSGTPLETYLRSRGVNIPPPPNLRFHAGLKHPSGNIWPAMVALVTRGADAVPLAIHRTFLAHGGTGKAPVEPQKMMLGPCRGGAVRLAPPSDVLMVGESIETCLAAMQETGHPSWAALSTSGLRSLDLPNEVRDIIVLADGDDPGEAAAQDCGRRWKREGRRVRIARPPRGLDFNDLLLGRAACIKGDAI